MRHIRATRAAKVANDTEWLPVTAEEADESGCLPATVLSGQDGAIRFEPVDPWEFGGLIIHSKFAAGTRSEITEPTILRGAPSATAAEKATLETGTLVTVTSVPAASDEGVWCPIRVEAIEEGGWVLVSVLNSQRAPEPEHALLNVEALCAANDGSFP